MVVIFLEGAVAPHWAGGPLNSALFSCASSSLQTYRTRRPFFLNINTQCYPLSSPLLRKALSLVIDRRVISQSIFLESVPYASVIEELEESYVSPTVEDIADAQKLFQEGIRRLGFAPTHYPPLKLLLCNDPEEAKLAEYLVATWQKWLNLHVMALLLPWNVLYHDLERGAFHIAGSIKYTMADDPIPLLDSFTREALNRSGWSHPTYQQLMAKAKKSRGARRTELLKEAEQLLADQAPFIPLVHWAYLYASHPSLERVVFDREGVIDFRWSSWGSEMGVHTKIQGFPCGQRSALAALP